MPKEWTVAMDEGHDLDQDPGSIANNGIKECKLNYNVGEAVIGMLTKCGIRTVRTKQPFADDISVTTRAKRANAANADLLLSIHHNGNLPGAKGYECIHQYKNANSLRLATYLAGEFAALGQTMHGKGIYYRRNDAGRDYYGILRGAKMPAVICEYAFLSREDVVDVDTGNEQKAEAKAIVKAICKYCGVSFKE